MKNSLQTSNFDFKIYFHCIAFYVILIAFYGYSFGDNDQIELMSYVKWLNNPKLYPSDFYIQHISERIPNERFFLAYLLSLSGSYLEWCTFILHACTSIILLTGLYKIAKYFTDNEWIIWLFFFSYFLFFYKFNLGGNDIYYNALSPAKPFAAWVIYNTLQKKYLLAALLAIFTTLLHPMVGIQVFILCFGADFITFLFKIIEKKISSEEKIFLKKYLTAALIFFFGAGIWLAVLFLNFNSGDLSNEQLGEIIKFRLPHHFIPSAYGLKNYLILLPLVLFGAYFYKKHSSTLFYFFIISILISITYTISIELFKYYGVVSTQWFKTTVWLKPLAVLAMWIWVAEKINLKHTLSEKYISILLLSLATLGICGMIYPFSIFKSRDYHFPFSKYETPEIDAAIWAKQHLPNNATFLTPADCTAFKFYSERGSYIDFKAVTHSKNAFGAWYNRINEVYHLEKEAAKGLALTPIANMHYSTINQSAVDSLVQKGVTHLLFYKNYVPNIIADSVYENSKFAIYKIQ